MSTPSTPPTTQSDNRQGNGYDFDAYRRDVPDATYAGYVAFMDRPRCHDGQHVGGCCAITGDQCDGSHLYDDDPSAPPPTESGRPYRLTTLPLCALCYGFLSDDDPCCEVGPAKDAVHVTEWAGATIVRQYDANPQDGPGYIDKGRREYLVRCVAAEQS